jgi:hypothetical protein
MPSSKTKAIKRLEEKEYEVVDCMGLDKAWWRYLVNILSFINGGKFFTS